VQRAINGRPPRRRTPIGTTVGRLITCTKCRVTDDVIEAQSPSLGPHQHVDPATYVCVWCLFPEPTTNQKETHP
jgi:hypothetical protein